MTRHLSILAASALLLWSGAGSALAQFFPDEEPQAAVGAPLRGTQDRQEPQPIPALRRAAGRSAEAQPRRTSPEERDSANRRDGSPRRQIVTERPEPPRFSVRPLSPNRDDETDIGLGRGFTTDPSRDPQAATLGAPTGERRSPVTGDVVDPILTSTVNEPVSRLPRPDVFAIDDEPLEVEIEETARTDDEASPYDPKGVDLGAFRLFPSIEFRTGLSRDNSGDGDDDGDTSAFVEISPELSLQSNWLRHEFDANLRGSTTRFKNRTGDDEISLDADFRLGIDVTRRTQVNIEGAYGVEALETGDTGAPDDVRERPNVHTRSIAGEIRQVFNRLALTLRGSRTETDYENARLEDGTAVDNAELDFRIEDIRLRADYTLSPKTEVFGEVYADRALFARKRRADGERQGSFGRGGLVGVVWRPGPKLDLEGSIGVDQRNPREGDVETGLNLRGSADWRVTALTTVSLRGSQSLSATSTDGASSLTTREVEIAFSHDFTPAVALTGGLIYGVDEFSGEEREDRRMSASAQLSYALNRYVAFIADIAHERVDSSRESSDQDETSGSLGLRLQF